MNKKFLLTIGLIVLSMQAAIAQKAIAMLNHNDTVTIYSSNQLQNAIDKAVDGDIIYLSEGLFSAFTVGKNITIMGAGKGTVIPGEVEIKKSNSLKLSNMHITGSLFFNNKDYISNTIITQCLIGDITFSGSKGTSYFTNIEIKMSQITGTILMNTFLKSLEVTNSKINSIKQYGSNNSAAKFINCNISSIKDQFGPEGCNSYQNCIIGTIAYGVFVNCLYKDGKNGTLTDCYQDADITLDDDLNCSITEAQLRTKGYLGSDGSVVGVDGGGDTPFTLASPLLQVVEHEIEVDNKNKRLRVTLNLGNK